MAKKNRAKTRKHKTQTRNDGQRHHPQHGNMVQNGLEQAVAAFTLADEARQTGQHDHSFWGHESKLRAQPVTFMSAGVTEPLKETEITPQHSGDEAEARAGKATILGAVCSDDTADKLPLDAYEGDGAPPKRQQNETEDIFFYDIQKTIKKCSDSPDLRAIITDIDEQSDDASSAEEIILFKGRSRMNNQPRDNISLVNITSEINELEKELHDSGAPKSSMNDRLRRKEAKRATTRKENAKTGNNGHTKRDEEDRLLADYIANLRENGELEGIMGLMPGADSFPEEDDSSSTGTESDDDDSDASNRTLPPNYARQGGQIDHDTETKDYYHGDSNLPGKQAGLSEDRGLPTMDYDDFDPMDWERPSLRRRKGKGSKAKLNLQFADLDIETEQRLQDAWRSDRLKKAERKRERESLRAAGLLGKNTDLSDLRIRYPTGMSAQQVMDEIKLFLMNSSNSLCFPPMGKNVRKAIHEVANKLNVKSKSLGKGDQRRPILYRTNRTVPYNESMYEQIVGRINRRYFPRLDSKSKNGVRQAANRNGYAAAASYRDGEIVGAAAPELGTENKGRNMLEKMGWSQGTALGAMENKGILLPVTQTMKRSKAGLG